jgi:hypothetical protein
VNPAAAGNNYRVEYRRVPDIQLGFYDNTTLRQAARGSDPERQYLITPEFAIVAGCSSCSKKSLAWSAQLVGSDPLEENQSNRLRLHVPMAMFHRNGAALLVLFEILQEPFSACGDRPYPTNNVRSASQFFGAFCSGRVNTSFTAQTLALTCEL